MNDYPDNLHDLCVYKIKSHTTKVRDDVHWFVQNYKGQEAALTVGKYKGRSCLIDGVISDNGEILFLCMVTRAGTEPNQKQFLKSDAEAQSYRPFSHFTVLRDE